MPLLILLLVLAAEVFGVMFVGRMMGSVPMAIWLAIGTSFLGASLMRRGRESLSPERMVAAMTQGGGEGGVLKLLAPVVGGLLLLFPGFITDLLGVAVLLPVTRPLFGKAAKALAMRALSRGAGRFQATGSFDFAAFQQQFDQAQRGGAPPRSGPERTSPPQGDDIKEADYRILD